jgi:alpha-tubulin suppressor-like RCC1 family protein
MALLRTLLAGCIAAGGVISAVPKAEAAEQRGHLRGGLTAADVAQPIQVPGLRDIIAIDAGGLHTAALRKDGTMWHWGLGMREPQSDGTPAALRTPTQVQGLTDVTPIGAGYALTMALRKDGTVWAWGDNASGQLGDGSTDRRSLPVLVGGIGK